MHPSRMGPRKLPLGRLAALLMAAGVTLIAVLRGVEPDVIVLRAAAAGGVCGLVVGLASLGLRRVLTTGNR